MSEVRETSQSSTFSMPARSVTTQAWYQEGHTRIQDRPTTMLNASNVTLESVIADVQELAGMPANWDSYNGDPPTDVAITAAIDLLGNVHRTLGRYVGEQMAPEFVAPRPDGGIQLEWGERPLKVSVHTTAEGKMGYLLVDWRSGTRRSTELPEVSLEATLQVIAQVVFMFREA